ncbi:thiamine pyrophosphokinase-related protein [Talaromyces proteolyticus]|uniref:Thiamine pyrophosphokinase-related protein n=1 Tax=Talaromyces proteolyticus TaxID=1131652 RepID=A0AAD4L0U1_9EURO|nr:thiamine pyrophosphokinase-related protein [Talaromyces proteolyticus]KAH8705467.1 thiamine pyrophosphokinase-related protein [Talaromyces proteolyticus]
MAKTLLDLVKECDSFPYFEDNAEYYLSHLKNYHAFKVNGCDAVLGYLPNTIVEKFHWIENDWQVDATSRTVTLMAAPGATPKARTEIMSRLLAEAVRRQTFEVLNGWRHEMYPIYGPGGEFLLEMERSASPLFGITTYGVHMTGYVEDEQGIKFWVARRSKTKQTFPNMLDNTAAGGMSTGEHPYACAIREAAEEASIPESVFAERAKSTGVVTYFYIRDARAGGETGLLQPEVEYIYDVQLDASHVIKPCDSEVEDFRLWTLDEVKESLKRGEWKPNCATVMIDFFIRHGILTAENEKDYMEIVARIHRRLPFPTATYN